MTHRAVDYDPSPIDAVPTSKAFWEQVLDRSIKTALQSLVVFFGGGVGILDIDWKQAGTAILTTVAITVFMSLSSAKLYEVESFYVDVVQRAARTFVATAVGVIVGLETLESIDWTNVANLAAGATVLSILSSFVSRPIGVRGTASVLRNAELAPVAVGPFTGYVPVAINPFEIRKR